MSTMRKALLTADDQALFDCNGTVDFACYYYDRFGRRTFCTLWINGCVIG